MEHTETKLSVAFSYILNFYDFAVLTTAVLAVVQIIPLLLKRDRLKSDILLCAFLFSQGAIAVNIVFLYNKALGPETVQVLYPFHYVPMTILYGLQGFLLYWYSQAMMGEPTKFFSKTSLVGASIIVIVATMGVYWIIKLGSSFEMKTPAIFLALPLSIIMGIRALSRLRQYDVKIRQRFSSIEQIKLNWLSLTALGFVGVWGLVLLSFLIGSLGFIKFAIHLGTFSNLPPMLLMSAMVIYSQTLPTNIKVFDSPPPASPQHDSHENKASAFKKEQLEKIKDLMERVKIYQDPDLRLEGLADCMKMSSRSVSTLLNGHFEKSFYDYINHYRVLDAQAQLHCADFKSKTIQKIFEDAGFNSKTTFNTLFKKVTGYTPSDYRKLPMQP